MRCPHRLLPRERLGHTGRMTRAAPDDDGPVDDVALRAAVEVVVRWGEASPTFTGFWTERRNAAIGVGIAAGDDLAATEHLQALMPNGVTAGVRLVSPAWARLRQLQVQVFDYLDDENLWGPYAMAVEVDRQEEHVEIGLLPTTPDEVAALIRARFPTTDVTMDRNASRAAAPLYASD